MVRLEEVVVCPVTTEMHEEAAKTATLKATHTSDTWLLNRKPDERFNTLFMGDLAKIAMKLWLRSHGKTVVDYDEIRVNNFEKNDPYDLMLVEKTTGKDLAAEIKSSFEKVQTLALAETLTSRNLMVYPGRESDINVQAYYLPSTGGYKNVNLIAWIEKESLIQFPQYTMPAQGLRERNRKQYKTPLYTLKPMGQLLAIIG